ncbi:hypothetical protein COOONC_01956 [Cooperia oncophora]
MVGQMDCKWYEMEITTALWKLVPLLQLMRAGRGVKRVFSMQNRKFVFHECKDSERFGEKSYTNKEPVQVTTVMGQ